MFPVVDYFTLITTATRQVLTSRWPQNWRRFKFLFLFFRVNLIFRDSIFFVIV